MKNPNQPKNHQILNVLVDGQICYRESHYSCIGASYYHDLPIKTNLFLVSYKLEEVYLQRSELSHQRCKQNQMEQNATKLESFSFILQSYLKYKTQTRQMIQKQVFIHDESTRAKAVPSRINQNRSSLLNVIDLQQSFNDSQLRIRFNCDIKFYTSAFIVEEEGSMTVNGDSILRQNFIKKMRQCKDSKDAIFKPKPCLPYCQICKESYQDYQKHIIHPVHTKNILASPAQIYIHDLCASTKHTKKSFTNTPNDSQLESNKPRKRIKLEDHMQSLKASSNITHINTC